MHIASGDIDVERSRLPEGEAGVDVTVQTMAKMAKGEYGSRSPKIRALAINIINAARVSNKDYYGMSKAIHEWVRDTIRYIKDPIGDGENGETLNQETLSYPEETAFNSQAGDCDDMTILEIALLGSLGIQSYPVVIGTQPGRYSHVYLHIILPPGKYPFAGKIIPADPIMREWPLGKEAPDYKVTQKKLYTDLSGLGTMTLGAYASAPSYLDTKNVSSVGPALRGRITDTGSRGRIMNAQEVARPSEDLDEMFNRDIHINTALQSASRNDLRPLGPLTARREQKLTSFLQVDGARKLPRLTGAKLVEVDLRKRRSGVRSNGPDMGPTVGELCGMSDYLSALEADIDRHAKVRTIAGHRDPLHRAAAALAYTHARARKAARKVHRIHKSIAIFGLGDDVAPEVDAAQEIEKLATAVALKAKLLANKATNGSPERIEALNACLNRLRMLDDAFRIPDLVASLPTGLDRVSHASTKVQTMAATVFDDDAVRIARKAVFDQGARAIPASPLKNPMLPGGVVRDQMGRIMYSDEMAGLGRWGGGGFKSIVSNISHAVASIPAKIATVPAKIAAVPAKFTAAIPKLITKAITAPVALTKQIVDAHKAFTMAHITGTMSAFNAIKSGAKGFTSNPFKKSGGGSSSSSASAAATQQKYTDPATGYIFDPATGKWTDPVTGGIYDPATGQWTGLPAAAVDTNTPPAPADSGSSAPYDPYSSSGGGGGSMAMPGSTDPSQYDPSYDPGNQAPTPDTESAGPSEGDDIAPQQSDDFPSDQPSGPQDMTSFQSPSSTTPNDSFGPEDMSTTSTDEPSFDPGSDDGSMPGDDASEGTLYENGGSDSDQSLVYTDDYGSEEQDDDATEGSVPQRRMRRSASAGMPVNGLGDGFAAPSIATLGLLAVGAYLLFKKRK